MGRHPIYIPLSLFTLAFTYVFIVMLNQVGGSVAENWVAAVASWIVFIIVFACTIAFIYRVWRDKDRISPLTQALGWLDGYISMLHALGLLAFSIIILGSPTLDFEGIPPGTRGFNLYWTYCLTNAVLFFNTAGRGSAAGNSALGGLWMMATSIAGVFYLNFALVLILRQVIPWGAQQQQVSMTDRITAGHFRLLKTLKN